MGSIEERQYRPAEDITAAQVETALDQIWVELQNDPAARKDVEAVGVDPEALKTISREDAVIVSSRGMGFGAEAIVIAFLPLVVKIAGDIWQKIILPRLEQKLGRGALTEEKR
jgi:hypothetical protein